jgi:Holliday junction DNA helicase RuvA
MISFLKGILDQKTIDSVILDVSGVGYKIAIPFSTSEKLPTAGKEIKLYIVESVAMYGGSTSFYGFLTEEERDMFNLLKEEVHGTGAKKALDYLEKVSKSLSDFRDAVVRKDTGMLTGVFGFTKPTAEKILAALKDKIGQINISGGRKWALPEESGIQGEAVAGLISLGYKEVHARSAVEKILSGTESILSVEDVITRALRYI